jgi:hypothetical protein
MQEKRHAQNEHVFLNITCFIAGTLSAIFFLLFILLPSLPLPQ